MFAVCFRQGIVQQMYVFFSSQLLRNLKSWPIDSIFHQFLMQQCTNPISTKFTGSEVKKKSWLRHVSFLVNTSFLVFCFYWSSSFQCYDWLTVCLIKRHWVHQHSFFWKTQPGEILFLLLSCVTLISQCFAL